MFDLHSLTHDNWAQVIDKLYPLLKKEMHGQNGFIRFLKEKEEPHRKHSIGIEIGKFQGRNSLSGLDEDINSLATAMLAINHSASTPLYYDFFAMLLATEEQPQFPAINKIRQFALSEDCNLTARDRLFGLCARIVNESLSQANKSNAGEAGENIVRAILSAAGLTKDVNFREQYQSSKGSDTDFVFPFVEDGKDGNVEAFLAVQMSSNDRTRLTASELRQGAKPFIFTGNGLGASKKKLKDIGNKIILDQKSKAVIVVCYSSELEREILRLQKMIAGGKHPKEAPERLAYFQDYGMTIQTFAEHVRKRFLD